LCSNKIIFYYDFSAVIELNESLIWEKADPFFSLDSKRSGIELLNVGNPKGIKNWLYQEFLSQSFPFADPRYIRTKLIQSLAQIRMHTKAFRGEEMNDEEEYHRLFVVILDGPVLYQIIQEIQLFTMKVTKKIHSKQHNKMINISDRIVQLIETNYWNTHWGLEHAATALDLSPSYVSRIFSKEENRSFRQF
jgi:two-component system response regulator YesN